jgi:ADP-heptose:LPS heptosyltransferase/lauroyl/myristoyl acyltransferase
MATLIKISGLLLSLIPHSVLELLTKILAEVLFFFPNKRRRVILSNLTHAFPKWSYDKVTAVGKESAAHMFEMGFFSLVYPYLSSDQCRRLVIFERKVEKELSCLRKIGRPVLLLIPHVALFESLAVCPNFRPQGNRNLGAIYRPNRNSSIDTWIKDARIKSGIKIFSRETAIWDAKKFLREKNWLGLLFDQNSGIQGFHSNFMNRFASMSTMPDLFIKSSKAIPVFAFPKRVGFFKSALEIITIDANEHQIFLKAHEILEDKIRKLNGLPEWLWSHERWKTQQKFQLHLRHRHKRGSVANSLSRTTKFWIRMPNWLGDVVMTLPLLDAIRRGRPDVSITVLAKHQFKVFLESLDTVDNFLPIPEGTIHQGVGVLKEYRRQFPSVVINFANSFRSDAECCLIGAPRRYGLTLPGRFRPLLSHSFAFSEERHGPLKELHQVRLWEKFLQYFGLDEELHFSPIQLPVKNIKGKIGILPGSANNPSKRWPVSHWRKLISLLIEENKSLKIFIYGASQESELANQILGNFDESKVINLCGMTNLLELANELASCAKVIGNDSGGMHLANAVGSPSVVLFGPTNPKVTAPYFNVPLEIIRAEETFKGKTSEQILARLSVTDVLEKINALG